MLPSPLRHGFHAALLGLTVFFVALGAVRAEDPGAGASLGSVPRLDPPPDLGKLSGRRVLRIDVESEGGRWVKPVRLRYVRAGETLSMDLAHRAMRELLDTGRYANVRAEVSALGEGARLRLVVLPRRVIASIKLLGSVLDDADTLRAARVSAGGELTAPLLAGIGSRIRAHYLAHGYPSARVRVEVVDTDDPLRVLLLVDITPGDTLRIAERWFGVWPQPKVSGLSEALSSYDAAPGDRVDEDALLAADRTLESTLKARGWHRATVAHRVQRGPGRGAALHVLVHAGPRVLLSFEGNRHFDATQLESALELEDTEDRAPSTLVQRVREFYVKRGFFDADVKVQERASQDGAYAELTFSILEHQPLRVSAREYPCLRGERSATDVGSEIDSFLSEELPGADLLDAVDPGSLDQLFGPTSGAGSRPRPYRLNPWKTYVPEVYERALKHLQDLYRSEGYLAAAVGPVEIVRRACRLHSPPGVCIPVGVRPRPASVCAYDDSGLPLEEPPPVASMCIPDPAKGRRCEGEAVLHIPVKLGPRSFLYDIAFEGNHVLVEKDLEEAAELELGAPASQVEIDKARRRLLDAYAEEGFAFAEVDSTLELSPDRTRARVRFVISERERVRVSRIVVRGARLTSERLIRSRIALEVGQPYRRSLVRKTEERLATLGVFSSVTLGFEDPYVPSREKVVVIELIEQPPQYTGVRGGFSTGEGFRAAFEYGHRNLFGEAIQLTLRVQLGYLPSALIFDRDVRVKYDELDVGDRLERRNTATLEFPEIGLGPLFRLSVEAVDVRDNARDFGLTKDAGIVTLIFRPERGFSVQAGASLELNQADIFAEAIDLSRVPFRVPEGSSVAVAERIGFTWDRRDNPLSATSGTLLSGGVEHVRACPDSWPCSNDESSDPESETEPDPFAPAVSEFLRFTNRLAGYIRMSDKGLSLAASFRWGYNAQLFDDSRTYPDRLFFMGGVETIRGYLQDSLVPEDIAEQITSGDLSIRDVAIRGGDLFVNPRAELRIPITANVQTALFVDAGNLWTRAPGFENMFELRYAVGTGLRIATPVGPVVFDYGFNLDRVLDEFYPDRANQRFWEDIGAFHFSIGLF
jgi:outer membrane protein assembly factor BamA